MASIPFTTGYGKTILTSWMISWIGFFQYRKFWTINNYEDVNLNIDKISKVAIKEIPDSFDDCEVILGKPFYVNQRRISKFFKKGLKIVLKTLEFCLIKISEI